MSSLSFPSIGSTRSSQFSVEAAGCSSCSHDTCTQQTRSGLSGPSVGYTGRPSLDSEDAGTLEVSSFSQKTFGNRGFSLLQDEDVEDEIEYPELESPLPRNKRKRSTPASPKSKGKKKNVKKCSTSSRDEASGKIENGGVRLPSGPVAERSRDLSPVRQVYALPRVDENEE